MATDGRGGKEMTASSPSLSIWSASGSDLHEEEAAIDLILKMAISA